jgi:hypothetical protein
MNGLTTRSFKTEIGIRRERSDEPGSGSGIGFSFEGEGPDFGSIHRDDPLLP